MLITFRIVPKHIITMNMDRHLKCIMTKFRFRFGVSKLSVHYYLYRSHVEKDLKCPLCGEAKENKVHFVLCCHMLDDIRKQFIPPKFCKHPCIFSYLVCCCQPGNCQKTINFSVFKAFKIRDTVTA